MATASQKLKPIILYDHLPGILAGYPALLFILMAVISHFDTNEGHSHLMFWIGMSVMIFWYIAFRFNLPKSRFIMLVGLMGTFVGIPAVLEVTNVFTPFAYIASGLDSLAPSVNTGAWIVMSMVFTVIWLGNLIWSRTHLKVTVDESGLTVNRMGGKGERFELIGLKTENEPLDYLELFLCGVGSLSLKTRMNKPIFKMDRVIGLYRTPWCPFFRSKLSRLEEMLSYQGKVVSVDKQDRLDMVEEADSPDDDDIYGDDGGEMDADEGGGGIK